MTEHGTLPAYDDGCRCPSCVNAQRARVIDATEAKLTAAVTTVIDALPVPEPVPTPEPVPEVPGEQPPA